MKKYKHITIFKSEEHESYNNKPVYQIINHKHNDSLGVIYYESAWNQYVFAPESTNVIFSVSCLNDIIDFIENEISF